MTRRRPTLTEVARLAGVSSSAVSRTFTPGASVAPATRARVLEAADLVGYRPNLLARSLSRQRSATVGIVVARLENSFNAVLLEHLAMALQKGGLGSRLIVTNDSDPVDMRIEEVLQHRVDVLVLCAVNLSSRIEEECAAIGVPVVMVNRATPGAGHDTRTVAVVGANDAGGRAVAAHLSATGHRRCAFVAGAEHASNSRERQAGFIAGLAAHDMPAPAIVFGQYSWTGAADAMRTLLRGADPPDAVFCANDHMALAAITVAQREFGLRLGQDVSIIGFDDSPAARIGAGLTSYAQPADQMAAAAVRAIVGLLDDSAQPEGFVMIPGALMLRGSSR